jgi:hypothetical protein
MAGREAMILSLACFGRQDADAERMTRPSGKEAHRALKPSKMSISSWSCSNTRCDQNLQIIFSFLSRFDDLAYKNKRLCCYQPAD